MNVGSEWEGLGQNPNLTSLEALMWALFPERRGVSISRKAKGRGYTGDT